MTIAEEPRCSLCGDRYHTEPDREGWMGLICPGATADEETRELFSRQLTEEYARHIAEEFAELHEAISERRRQWYERERTPVSPEVLQANIDELTQREVDRQHNEGVWQDPEVEIE